ncbi:recombinase family protein [Azospirillum sp. B21]|uniref:recombinase family protein n=1 Tax=Azospirillum sp. B21 TaxID=2607496 RepID=UPI0011EE6B93|nr:recombinase family protein [Azospirillum sp. B21]KAA0571582.1 recombinase family protein [Azospirillum sp. B21]
MAKPPTRTVAYIRVSSADQADHGHSLAAQREKIGLYAKLHDLDLVAVIEDAGASAKTTDRPGLQRVLAMLDSGEAAALLVPKLDRLTRSVRDLGALIDRYFAEGQKAALLSVADSIDTRSAGGRLVLNVLASVSQWEREVIVERTRDTLRSMKAAGKVIARPTLGYDVVESRLVANVNELALIDRIKTMHAAGTSYNAIAAKLTDEGVPTKRGGAWQATTVRGIVLRAN